MHELGYKSGHPATWTSNAANHSNPFAFILLLAALGVALMQSGCVSLTGSLGLSQSNLNFGKVVIGSSSGQAVTLKNDGGGVITITGIAASGTAFTVSGPQLPLHLVQGQSVTFQARFAPPSVGETSGNLQITETQTSTPQFSGAAGSATPTTTTVRKSILMAGTGVSAAPSITAQPASQNVLPGQSATFSVTASGASPLSYQWSKNGAAIAGATSATYTTPATTVSENGSQFTVAVSNSAGSVTSNAATLTVGGAGQLSASATRLSYGNVAVGSSSSQAVTLTNTGNTSVSISNVSLNGAGLSTSGVSSGLILAAGNWAVLHVTFAPSAAGTLSGSVTVTSNATDSAVTIAVAGAAVPPASHAVTLSLAPNSSNVSGYNVYRSSTSGGPYTKLNSPLVTITTYVDSTVVASQTYYYVGTSVDSSGNETTYSDQVTATIPTP
jgi:hypothetical protein